MGNNKLYVGNLSYSCTEDQLKTFFAEAGNVVSARIIKDRDSGRSKGFGFVEMSSPTEAQKAIETLNGKELMGRACNVSEAKAQSDGPRGGGGGGGGGGFGGRPRR